MSTRVTLRSGSAEAVLDPGAGGRIAALRVDGLDLLVAADARPVAWGCYPMVPWAGRVRDGILCWGGEEHQLPTHLVPPHAIHGTLLETAWETIDSGPATATLGAELGPPWPFGGHAVHRLTLGPTSLHAVLEVHAADRPMPVIVGWHPWFLRVLRDAGGAAIGDPAIVNLAAGGMLRRDGSGIPTDEIVRPIPPEPWDDCFIDVVGAPGVTWPGALEVRLTSEAPYWVVYTEPQHAVCVEPQTGPPNGLNTGQHAVVVPGRPLVASMAIGWRRLA